MIKTEVTSLEEICYLVTDGKHGNCENEADSGFYFLSCKDISDGRIQYKEARQITEADFLDTHRRTQLEPYDILLTNSGTIGRMVLVKNGPRENRSTLQKSVAILKPRHDIVCAEWLYYYLQVEMDRLVNFAGGTAQKNLLLRDLRPFSIEMPPMLLQSKIASILSAYDNLIDNNIYRITIMEEICRSIYQNWFVNFRFPGYEKVKLVDSPFGQIPEGWDVKRLDEIVIFQSRGTKAGEHLKNLVYLPIDCIPKRSLCLNKVRSWKEAKSSLHLFNKGDILFGSMRPYFHKVVVAPFDGVTRKTCFVFKPKMENSHAFATMTLFQDKTVEFANSHSKGTTMPYAVWKQSMDGMRVVTPSPNILQQFEKVVQPILQNICLMYDKNLNLRHTRDILMPKLIRGNLDVDDDFETSNLSQIPR